MTSSHRKLDKDIFNLRQGKSKLLVSIPHVGTQIPDWLKPRLTEQAQRLPDTDWYLNTLYDFLDDLDVTVISANYSRYVVDLNRSSDDISLYPGHNVTGLCPIDAFSEEGIYQDEAIPSEDEIEKRVKEYWTPYHHALETEIARLQALHGEVVVWDAHSIRTNVPRFFEGDLPELNLGTADGHTCRSELIEQLVEIIKTTSDYSWVVNGRFKGGFITRHYGNADSINSIQLEIAMRAYCDESSLIPEYDHIKATQLKTLLRTMIESLIN